jgi:hypothetical protein
LQSNFLLGRLILSININTCLGKRYHTDKTDTDDDESVGSFHVAIFFDDGHLILHRSEPNTEASEGSRFDLDRVDDWASKCNNCIDEHLKIIFRLRVIVRRL